MTIGRVVRFDEARGFGFIAPLGGSEDVFLHVNDLLIPESLVRPGAMLKFDIDEGERGLKASNISLPENNPRSEASTRLAAVAAATSTQQTIAAASSPHTIAAASSPIAADGDGDEFCDLLTTSELSSQVTELLLSVVPPLTGDQVLTIRSRLTEFAKDHGWLVP